MDTLQHFPAAAPISMPIETAEYIGTCDTVKSMRVPRTHVPARGMISRGFRQGVVGIALQFSSAIDAQSALSVLVGWRAGSARAPHILIWTGDHDSLAVVSSMLRGFGADMSDVQFDCNIPV